VWPVQHDHTLAEVAVQGVTKFGTNGSQYATAGAMHYVPRGTTRLQLPMVELEVVQAQAVAVAVVV
jgi:hypothetical protein